MSILLKAITNSETTLMIQQDASLPVPAGVIQLESEQISYTSNYMGTLYGCTRGINGTTPATHDVGIVITVPDFYFTPAAGEVTVSDINSGSSTNGQVITSDGAGNASWEDAAGGGATTALDNLTTTAINADLLVDTDNSYSLGSASAEWAEINVINVTHNSASNTDMNIGIGSGTGVLNLYAQTGAVIGLKINTNFSLQVDDDATATNTRMLLWDVDADALVRVSVGAADSGGTGFKVLRIPN